MNEPVSIPTDVVAAGPFSEWLRQMRRSLQGNQGMDVPCGDCVGCCVSAYSVQLRPEDQRAVARIPAHYLVNAPGFPAGHLTMAALPNGLCPMLESCRCSIYSVRPQTCLDYDCRIFAAAGMEAGAGKAVINKRVREWRFSYPSGDDQRDHEAVRAAAAFIRDRNESFAMRVPTAPMGIAVLAIKAYAVFLTTDIATRTSTEIANAIIAAGRAFDRPTQIGSAPGSC